MIALVFYLPGVTMAKEGALTVAPAFSDITLTESADRAEVILEYKNGGSETVELEIGAIDFRQTDNGVLQYVGQDAGSYSYSLASFLTPEANTLVLDPGEKKEFTVTINNKESLSPGGHYAAVTARIISAAKRGTARIQPSVSALILLRKTGGERFNLSLVDADWPQDLFVFRVPNSIRLTFQNEGNVHLVPYGTVELIDMFGRMTHKGVINTSSLRIFPETRRYITTDVRPIANIFPLALYSVKITGNDSLNKVTYSQQQSFIYIDYRASILLFISAFFVWKIRTRRRNGKKD